MGLRVLGGTLPGGIWCAGGETRGNEVGWLMMKWLTVDMVQNWFHRLFKGSLVREVLCLTSVRGTVDPELFPSVPSKGSALLVLVFLLAFS